MTLEDEDTPSNKNFGSEETDHARRYEIYLADRSSKLALDSEQSKFIDGAILSLGGGALALLLTYLHGLSAPPTYLALVQVGAASLVLSIALALGSVFASQLSIGRYIANIDAEANRNFTPLPSRQTPRNCWVQVTAWLNTIAFISLIVGIVAAASFSIVNMPLENPTRRNEANGQHIGLGQSSDTASGRRLGAGSSNQTATSRATAHAKTNGR